MANKLDNPGSNIAVAFPKCLKLKDYCFLITYQNSNFGLVPKMSKQKQTMEVRFSMSGENKNDTAEVCTVGKMSHGCHLVAWIVKIKNVNATVTPTDQEV